MGDQRKHAYRDPYEDEYIYNALVNYPADAKARLTPQELSNFETPGKIRRFVNNATSDQKKLLLAKANIRFVSLYVDLNQEKPLDLPSYKKIYRANSSTSQREALLDEIKAGNTFAVSSREIINSAYLIAQNCHTPWYYVNQTYRRVYDSADTLLRMRGLKDYNGSTTVADLREADKCRDFCVNFFMSVASSEAYMKMQHQMDSIDSKIIMHLYLNRDSFVQRRTLDRLLFEYKKASISNKLSRLLSGSYIDINRAVARSPSYTIAEMGLIVVNDVVSRVAQEAVNL